MTRRCGCARHSPARGAAFPRLPRRPRAQRPTLSARASNMRLQTVVFPDPEAPATPEAGATGSGSGVGRPASYRGCRTSPGARGAESSRVPMMKGLPGGPSRDARRGARSPSRSSRSSPSAPRDPAPLFRHAMAAMASAAEPKKAASSFIGSAATAAQVVNQRVLRGDVSFIAVSQRATFSCSARPPPATGRLRLTLRPRHSTRNELPGHHRAQDQV